MEIVEKNKREEENEIQLSRIKRIWLLTITHWYIFVFCIAIAIGGYAYYASTLVSGVIAQMQLSLKYNKENGKDYSDYTNEMTGINAPSLIQETIDQLNLNVSYFSEKNGDYVEVFNKLPFKVTVAIATNDLQEELIKFKIINKNQFELSYNKAGANIVEQCYFDSAFVNADLRLKAEMVVSNDSLSILPSSAYCIQIHDMSSLVGKYQSNIKTKLTKDLAVLQVTYKDILPNRAIAFLDTLARAYLNTTIKSQTIHNNKMVRGIDQLLKGTEMVLRKVEDSLRMYRHEKHIFNEDIEGQKYISMSTNLMLEKRELELKKMELAELQRYIVEGKKHEGLPPPYFLDSEDNFITKTISELYDIQLDKKTGKYEVTEKSYGMNRLDFVYDVKKADLIKYLQNDQTAIDSKLAFYDKQIATNDNVNNKAYTSDQFAVIELTRQLKVNEAMYMSLLEKRNSICVAQAAMAPEYKIFESAHIIEYFDNFDYSKLCLFLFFGILAATGIIYVKNFFFEQIDTLEFLKAKTDLPVLGEMPFVKIGKKNTLKSAYVYGHPLGYSQLGAIRTHLEYILTGKKSKVIVITSHNSSDGKTFNAINLAAILAKTGKRVLLLDMDFHKPSLGSILSVNVKTGMSEVYSNKVDFAGAITQCGPENGFDAIVADAALEDASEKILSKTTLDLIEFGKKNYDYVIIDTPPVGIISDALTLMQYSSLVIYIMNAEKAYHKSLVQVEEIVTKNKFNIHLVLNKVKIKRLQYYSRQYENYRYRYAKVS